MCSLTTVLQQGLILIMKFSDVVKTIVQDFLFKISPKEPLKMSPILRRLVKKQENLKVIWINKKIWLSASLQVLFKYTLRKNIFTSNQYRHLIMTVATCDQHQKRKNSKASSAAIEDQSRRKIWNSRGSSSNLIEKGFFYSFQNLGG